jgi:hypothetical protein
MCTNTAIYVPSYCYIFVLILQYMRPHAAKPTGSMHNRGLKLLVHEELLSAKLYREHAQHELPPHTLVA